MFRFSFQFCLLTIVLPSFLTLSWAELRTARYDSCNLVVNNTLYVFGGKINEDTLLSTVEILDLSANVSKTIDYYIFFSSMTCFSFDGVIYMLGTTNLTKLYEFDGQVMIYSTFDIGNVYSISNYVRQEYIIMNYPTIEVDGASTKKSFGIVNMALRAVIYVNFNCLGSSAVISDYNIYYAGGLCNNVSNNNIYVYNTTSSSVAIVGETYSLNQVYVGIYNNRIDVIGNEAFSNGTQIPSDVTRRYHRYLNPEDIYSYTQVLPRMNNLDDSRFISTKYGIIAYNQELFIVANTTVRTTINPYPIAKSSSVFLNEDNYLFPGGVNNRLEASNKIYNYYLPSNIFTELIFSNDAPIAPLVDSPSISAPFEVPLVSTPKTGTPEALIVPNQTDDQTVTIVVVIVVVVVVTVAIAVVTVLLKRRHRQRKLRGDLKFIKELGSGSYGKVYLAKWQGIEVAVKVNNSNSSDFEDETKLMIKLPPHPNIVQVLGVSKHPATGESLLVLEYCNGTSLDRLLYDTEEKLTQAKQLELARMICQGMIHLHSNGVVHRDLSSRNVLLHNGVAKISDFGMARTIGSSSQGQTKTNIGPVRWMSPESLRNNSYSYKSDVWSFGIVLYEILARSEPHIDIDPIEVGRLIRDFHLRPVPPPESNKVLVDLMNKCLASNPEDRPAFEEICSILET
jgi:predicted Ser/Thr protein kinase